MFSKLFHKDVYFPKGVKDSVYNLESNMKGYFLSNHFEKHLNNQDIEDRSHKYFRNAVLNCLNEMCSKYRRMLIPFEVELSKDYHFFGKSGWFVTKYCVRIPYDSTNDLVVVIRPQWDKQTKKLDVNRFMVVTAWLNHNQDDHETLDESKYCNQNEWLGIK